MGILFTNKYPYTDMHELNLDWLLSKVSELENRLKTNNIEFINVKQYGAVGDGVTDDYEAFRNAYNDASEGSAILIPYGAYHLSDDPEEGSKIVRWIADTGTTFNGHGIGNPEAGAGKFGCCDISNPWIIISGSDEKYNLSKVVTPVGGGVYANAHELYTPDASNVITISGNLTNGSSILSNVNTDGIHPGDGIIPVESIAEFPSGDSISNTMRVITVTNNSIVFGLDAGNGVGAFTPTVFTGISGSYTFTIRKRMWQGITYEGLNTGKEANRDAWHWVYNSVVNLHKQPAFQMELDFNVWDTAEKVSRCLSLTGIGTGRSNVMALEIVRGGSCNWSYGIQIGESEVGIDVGAAQPIYIRSLWHDNTDNSDKVVDYGIRIDNIPEAHINRPLFAGKQLTNGSNGVIIERNTDALPTGELIACKQTNGQSFFSVNANGFTSVLGLQILAAAQDGSGLNASKYLTISDGNGRQYKLLLAE